AMCRLCLVEVEGAPKPMPGCVTTVAEGQVVRTQSSEALKHRRGVLEFYLVNHPLDCPICDMSGECYLQDYVHAEGPAHG
ncbi:MAG: NADH-quinone oxidoreductase subunit G, partial [Gemmatimonadetes bacterium]|nr:NADH-quinone oxidoreductase subunit G [Gemmatimonadota bacterium]NIV77018.1 NADH-quinone oxidoreductase subunit G [Gammaproteobacteria bacterium]NIX47293.1 NADH-quinone oxidoreductase subunit G [Gemmatimonadota bacterium]NIY11668.1 NADH-quinone oxidoreductase subunit G [Gemmatimonadota bacterium]